MSEEPGFAGNPLKACRIAILGLGLMGGSLAMALRGKCARLVGVDRDPEILSLALERQIVDAASTRIEDFVGAADMLILAMPVKTILSTLRALDSTWPLSAVILDLGSTKAQIVETMQRLPERFQAVGGHPMCGKEHGSLHNADPAIYQDATFALVRMRNTDPGACGLAEEVVRAAGANPLWIQAEQHDQWVAETSHVPFLVSSALAAATRLESAQLIGPGFRSTTRLASSPSEMMMDVLETNVENVRTALARARKTLDRYDTLLEQGDFQGLTVHLNAVAGHLLELERLRRPNKEGTL